MEYSVQMFGYNWDDDRTITLAKDGGAMLQTLAHGTVFTTLSEAGLVADRLWELFWETRTDNYRDDNPHADWQFVVAVFAAGDESGQHPVYTRGFAASRYAPWVPVR